MAGPALIGKQDGIKIPADGSSPGTENEIAGRNAFGHQDEKPGAEQLGGSNEVPVKKGFHASIPDLD